MSKIEVDAIDKQSGSTLTLGGSGTAVTLACGATQTGFGRTGTVDWQTTPKTGDFTAVNGQGYFVDTTSGTITMTMPSGSAGAIVSIQDYNNTFDNNNFTIAPASGEKINGGTASANLVINIEGQGLTFVYVDGTVGWKTVHENEFTQGGANFIAATGGTITTSGDCKIHTFTGPGTFCVSAAGNVTNGVVSYMVIAGGGGGGSFHGGGGGAGGYREFKSPVTPYTASPLNGNPGGTSVSINTVTSIPVTVGAGGVGTKGPSAPGGPVVSTAGSDSVFSTITSAGGGRGGGSAPSTNQVGGDGGSGGGGQNGVSGNQSGPAGGSGNTPPVSPAQGKDGGTAGSDDASFRGGGGGGGATAVGANVTPSGPSSSPASVGPGGAGATTSINGSPVTRAGGGSGGSTAVIGTGGPGGGGQGGTNSCNVAAAGTANTGGGGGGAGNPDSFEGGAGGSGIVIIRYKFQ